MSLWLLFASGLPHSSGFGAFPAAIKAALAQLAERRSRKAKVSGSIPEGGSRKSVELFYLSVR